MLDQRPEYNDRINENLSQNLKIYIHKKKH